ncbi:MAG: glycosyltransferase family 4 protein [Candidatus Bathyarchaeia archaeon]
MLFVREPFVDKAPGGPKVVALKLIEHLNKKANIVFYPRITHIYSLSRLKDVINKLSLSYRAILTSDVDLIHFISIPIITDLTAETLILLNKLRNIPIILNIHGIVYKMNTKAQEGNVLRNKLSLISHIKMRGMDKIVVNSRYMKVIASSYYNLPENKIVMIPNGVDIKIFTPFGDRVELDGDPAILYVGRISWEKGIDVLVKALKLLKEDFKGVRVHIVGSGSSIRNVILLAKRLNVDSYIEFHGSVSHYTLPFIFRGADVFVLLSRVESFGMVLLEAMGCGLPVVASEVGGIPEIIKNYENGILVKPEDPIQLSKSIREIYFDKALRRKLSMNSMKTASKYSWENIVMMYLKLYEQVTLKINDQNLIK